jgi:WD40 repeat protein
LRHDGLVAGAAFTAAGAELVSWQPDGTILVWDVKEGEIKKRHTIGAKGDKLPWPLERAAPLGPTRWLLLAGRELLFWDSMKGSLAPALVNSSDSILDWHLTGAGGALLLTRGQDLYDLKRQTKSRSLGKRNPVPGKFNPAPADLFAEQPGPGYRGEPVAAFTADGRRVVWADRDRMWLFEVSTGKELQVFDEAGFVNALALSADGSRAVTGEARRASSGIGVIGNPGHTVRFWDLKAKKLISTHSRRPSDVPYPLGQSVALAPDGGRALICWRDDKGGAALELVDLGTGSCGVLDETYPPLPPASITEGFNFGGGGAPSARPTARTIDSAMFSPDGRHAISFGKYGAAGGEIRVWRLPTAETKEP